MNIGFIGTGKISSSVIKGICSSKIPFTKIWISPRNKIIAANLKKNFKKIIIAKTNQEIVDNCNWVFLSITPMVAQKIIKNLKFKPSQTIISFISTITLSELKKTIPTRVYILVGLPGSGKTTWSENFKFYLDKRSIVIDCCNLSYFERSDWVSLIKISAPEASICAVYFDTPFEIILERNESRPFDRALPKDKLEQYRKNFQFVDYHKETHFNELIIVRH